MLAPNTWDGNLLYRNLHTIVLDKVLSLDDNEYYVVYPDALNAPKQMRISKKALRFVGDIPEDIKKKIDVPDWVFVATKTRSTSL